MPNNCNLQYIFTYIQEQGRGTKYNIKLFKLFKRKASEPKEKFKLLKGYCSLVS